ncbi:MAG: hypothetical protein ABEJ85_04380 [Haloarculaceae archaeon]
MTDRPDAAAWAGLALLSLLVLGYSLLIAGNVLLGVVVVALLWLVPLAWSLLGAFLRFVDAVEDVADALQRLAAVREADRERARD